eukprot:scaffold5926_cov102-Cylindrotheca_fusiformis.AAC.3
MAGWSTQERRHKLQESYGFDCQCSACTTIGDGADHSEPLSTVMESLQSIREVQYSCNEQLLAAEHQEQDPDQMEHIISLIQMTQRGIRNNSISDSHEVSIECERLLAMAYTRLGQWDEAEKHHELFFNKVKPIVNLFDPVALATQYLEYYKVLLRLLVQKKKDPVKATSIRNTFVSLLQTALGKDHPWLRQLLESKDDDNGEQLLLSSGPVLKKQRMNF